ncbi:MAG: hypothetical protein L6R40_002455 [Gallowayella cf. fulva]|nr:MAG: hypothetical protein L6R40_002455 [Xanthomendoza cf. fulva]
MASPSPRLGQSSDIAYVQSSARTSTSPLASGASEGQRITDLSRPGYGTRPSSSSVSSAHKFKKRVPWRGKTCIILLPNPSSRTDFQKRDCSDSHQDPADPNARTRPSFPDPEEDGAERVDRQFRIKLPDKAQWDLYVKNLQEAKLRALGVSIGDEDSQAQNPQIGSPLYQHPSSCPSSLPVSPSFARPRSIGSLSRNVYSVPIQSWDISGSAFRTSPASGFGSKHMLEPDVTHSPRYSMPKPQQSTELPLRKSFMTSVSPTLVTGQSKYCAAQHTGPNVISPSAETVLPVYYGTFSAGSVLTHSSNSANLSHNAKDRASCPSLQQPAADSQGQHYYQDLSPLCNLGSSAFSMDLQQSPNRWHATPGDREPAIRYPTPRSRRTSIPEALERRLHEAEDSHQEKYGESYRSDLTGQMESTVRDKDLGFAEEPSIESLPEGTNYEHALGHAMRKNQNGSSASGLNALAPEFKMGESGIRSISSVAGKTMRPTAPIFTPASVSQQLPVSHEFTFLSAGPVFKPVPSISKAIPIMKPEDKWSTNVPEGEVQEDESGRITQADSRQKRQRRTSEMSLQNAQFALPAQLSCPSTNPHSDSGDLTASTVPRYPYVRQDSKSLEMAAQAANQLKDIIDDLSTSEDSSSLAQTAEGVDPNEKRFTFQDITEAIAFDAARPRSSSGKRKASRRFFSDHARPLDEIHTTCGSSSRQTSSPSIDSANKENIDPQQLEALARSDLSRRESSLTQPVSKPSEIGISGKGPGDISRLRTSSQSNYVAPHNGERHVEEFVDSVSYIDPSYEELDAVIKHLNDDDSIARTTANRGPLETHNPDRISAHDFQGLTTTLHLQTQNGTPMAKDDDGQSQRYQYLPPTESESVNSSVVRLVANNARFSPSYRPSNPSDAGEAPCNGLDSAASAAISEWDRALSSSEEAPSDREHIPLEARMKHVVSKIMDDRLMPLEESLAAIQVSLSELFHQSSSRIERPRTPAKADMSDADDEDDIDCTQPVTRFAARDRKIDEVKAMMSEILASQEKFVPASELGTITQSIKDLKALFHEAGPPSADVKSAIEEAIKRQMRGKSAPITSSHQSATVEKSQLQIAGLESMLKIAEGRAEDEMKARRATEDALADSQRLLRLALQDAAEQRESAEETEQSLAAFHEERHDMLRRNALLEGAQESVQRTASEVTEKNLALEGTLEEYRLSSAQWREEIESAKIANKDLRRTVNALRTEMEDGIDGRHALRAKFDRLQEEVAVASQNIAREQSLWRIKEEAYRTRCQKLGTDGEQQRQKIENMVAEITALSEKLRVSQHEHHQINAQLERQLHDQQERARLEKDRMQKSMDNESRAAKWKLDDTRAQSEVTIANLHSQLNQATRAGITDEARLERLLQEAVASGAAALEERQAFHDQVAGSMRDQNERLSQMAMREKHDVELQHRNRLALAEEKLCFYQDKVVLLEEKLEVAKSAAQAAVQAVRSSRPTSSNPHQGDSSVAGSVSSAVAKTSPQALRESILVLQEQLQDREIQIEQLQQKLAAVDTEAPKKLKARETEMTWLRELLGVRVDDLEDLITALSRPVHNREAIKDAAIRLKASIEMEQQEKERAQHGSQTFPTLASISNLTSSPRSLPLAAAAAWGNWRKGRMAPVPNVFGGGDAQVAETPSRFSSSTQSGLMSPPDTEMRGEHQAGRIPKAEMHPSSRKRRARSTARQRDEFSPHNNPPPVPPSLTRRSNHDMDAESTDVGALQNTVDGSGVGLADGEEGEPFGPGIVAFPARVS